MTAPARIAARQPSWTSWMAAEACCQTCSSRSKARSANSNSARSALTTARAAVCSPDALLAAWSALRSRAVANSRVARSTAAARGGSSTAGRVGGLLVQVTQPRHEVGAAVVDDGELVRDQGADLVDGQAVQQRQPDEQQPPPTAGPGADDAVAGQQHRVRGGHADPRGDLGDQGEQLPGRGDSLGWGLWGTSVAHQDPSGAPHTDLAGQRIFDDGNRHSEASS